MNLENITYGIIGLGLMGGTIAKSLRKNVLSENKSENQCAKIIALDKNKESLENAFSEKIIDSYFLPEETKKMLLQCDVVFICLYPHATLDFLLQNKENFKSGSIITDISGVKGIFEKKLPSLLRSDVDFIIGHPMAGGEKEGYTSSNSSFFNGRNYILIPENFNKKENLDFFKKLIYKMGFSKITETTAGDHDYKIGFTSQLCHVIASALVESAPDEKITAFGGGSFEDLTRIAMINAPLWTELFISNKEKLTVHIENFIARMNEFKNLIQKEDKTALENLLKDVREKRSLMGGTKKN